MTTMVLPPLVWRESPNQSDRASRHVRLIVVHRWGGGSYRSNVEWMCNPNAQVSAHLVYGGSASHEATQLVRYSRKAWTEAAYNSVGESVESADAIWQAGDDFGFRQLARIVAFRLHERGLPAVWLHGGAVNDPDKHGVCRHADLGQAGGGHLFCPTTDIGQWERFMALVASELARGGFRKEWGRW